VAPALLRGVRVLKKRLIIAAFAAVLLVLAGVGGAVLWLVGSEAGLRWAVAQLDAAGAGRLSIERPRGTLASGMFADRLAFENQGTKLVVERFAGRLRLAALLSAEVSLAPLSIERLTLELGPDDGKPPQPPHLPIGVRLRKATIGELQIARGDTRLALRDVQIEHFSLGALHGIAGAGRFSLVDERFPASGRLRLDGTLERLQLRLGVELMGAHADVAARLAPFSAQRVDSLDLHATGVDLQRFLASLPATALEASLKARGTRDGLRGTLSLANARAGALDAGRLPIAGLRTAFTTVGTASASFEGAAIEIADGGVLQGGGEIAPGRGAATLEAKGLNLRALRSSLRRTALEGTLNLVVTPQTQTLRAALSQEGIRLSLEALRRGDTIELGALHAEAEGGEASGAGVVTLGEPIRFQGRLGLAGFDPSAFGDYPAGDIDGTLELSGTLGETPYVDASWTVADSSLYDLAFASQGRARFARERVTDADASASLGESNATVRGSFGRLGDELQFTLQARELSELAADIAGRLETSGTLRGTWSAPQATLSARAEALELPGGIRAERATARLGGTPARHGLSLTAHAYDSDIAAELRGGWDGEAWRAGSSRSRARARWRSKRPRRHPSSCRASGSSSAGWRHGWSRGGCWFASWCARRAASPPAGSSAPCQRHGSSRRRASASASARRCSSTASGRSRRRRRSKARCACGARAATSPCSAIGRCRSASRRYRWTRASPPTASPPAWISLRKCSMPRSARRSAARRARVASACGATRQSSCRETSISPACACSPGRTCPRRASRARCRPTSTSAARSARRSSARRCAAKG
jgi:hypothetical protein